VVRVSLSAYGFLGQRLMPKGTKDAERTVEESYISAASSRPKSKKAGGAKPDLGLQPFVAVISQKGAVTMRTPLGVAHRDSQAVSLALRAPASSPRSSDAWHWALQLFASDDGCKPLAEVGPPLPIRVKLKIPGPPGQPRVVESGGSPTSCFLTVVWAPPTDEGGSAPVAHELSLWLAETWRQGAAPLQVFCGEDVWPPYQLDGLDFSTEYVMTVRCQTEAGHSPWSKPSA
ncbi:unnamed protein product, partial [Polarella glacialis]